MGETVKGGLDVLKTRIEELECELDRVTKKYARLIQLINLCPHAFYAIDYDGRFLFVNRIAGKFLGAAPKDIVGRSYAEVRGAAEAARILKLGRSIIDSGEPHITSEQRMVDAGGTERVLQFHDIPYFDEEYGVRAVLGVGTALCGLAPTAEAFVAARMIVGFGIPAVPRARWVVRVRRPARGGDARGCRGEPRRLRARRDRLRPDH